MSRSFKLKAVLRHLDKGLLVECLKKHGYGNLPDPDDGQDENELWEGFVQGLPSTVANELETALRDINDMATEDGLLALLEIAENKGVRPQEALEKLSGYHDKTLYFFLHHPGIFDFASITHHVTDLKAKVERFLKKRPAEAVAKKGKTLAGVLRDYLLSADGRGRECEVNVFQHEGHVCFIAYPEDFAKSPLCYDRGRLKKHPLRPTFEIVYIYYPKTGKVELSAKGGPKRQMDLFRIFNRVVLEDEKAVPELEKTYRLEMFLDGGLKLPTDAADEVEYVRLSKLRLSHKFDAYRVTLDLKHANGLDSMREALGKMRLHPAAFAVVQAEIKMKFPGRGRKGSVTIQLSYPDKCNLNDSPLHLKAKNYLEEWGLVHHKSTEKPPRRAGREPSATAV